MATRSETARTGSGRLSAEDHKNSRAALTSFSRQVGCCADQSDSRQLDEMPGLMPVAPVARCAANCAIISRRLRQSTRCEGIGSGVSPLGEERSQFAKEQRQLGLDGFPDDFKIDMAV